MAKLKYNFDKFFIFALMIDMYLDLFTRIMSTLYTPYAADYPD